MHANYRSDSIPLGCRWNAALLLLSLWAACNVLPPCTQHPIWIASLSTEGSAVVETVKVTFAHWNPSLPVALAKPMLTVGLFNSLILRGCVGGGPNTPRGPATWHGHTAAQLFLINESGKIQLLFWVKASLEDNCLTVSVYVLES